MSNWGWIGVDLDGTLAEYHGWKGADHIGEPVPAMVERVRAWLAEGRVVKIFTARVGWGAGYSPVSNASDDQAFIDNQRQLIEAWCVEHIGQKLEVTAVKDWAMVEMWDDRCVQVVPNTGKPVTA